MRLLKIHGKIRLQLTLGQHRFELCGSTYTQVFFNKYSACIFIFQIFK